MKHWIAAGGLATATFLLLLPPIQARGERALSGGTQDEAKLAEELEGLVHQLREERAAYYQRHRARGERLESARAPVRRLEQELADLRTRDAEADRTLAEARSDLEKLRRDEGADLLRSQLAPDVDQSLREGRDFVSKGIPYRREDRSERLGTPEQGTLQEKVARYWSFLQEEARVARSGEVLSTEVPVGAGRVKPARVFRVGHLVMGYVTEDGLEAGLWNGKEWAPAASADQEKAIRQAVEILDRRRTPELLNLPVLRRGAP